MVASRFYDMSFLLNTIKNLAVSPTAEPQHRQQQSGRPEGKLQLSTWLNVLVHFIIDSLGK